ncbi:hypothetical protein JCM10207_008630 [Rhodosporidiobolus poonsookiae]
MSFLSRFTRSREKSSSGPKPSASKSKPAADPSPLIPLDLPQSSLLSETSAAAPLLLRSPVKPRPGPSSHRATGEPDPNAEADADAHSLRSIETTPWVEVPGDGSPRTARIRQLSMIGGREKRRDPEQERREWARCEKARLGVSEVTLVLDECGAVIRSRGLTTLGLFRPYRLAESRPAQLKLILLFLDYVAEFDIKAAPPGSIAGSEASKAVLLHAWREELRYCEVLDAVGVLKWAFRHLTYPPSTSFAGTPTPSLSFYTAFLSTALSSPTAFLTSLLPSLPPSSQHLLLSALALIQHVAAFSSRNAMSARRLCRLLGVYLFGFAGGEGAGGVDELYRDWQRAGDALEGCLRAYLREQSDLPPRLQDLLVDYDGFVVRQRAAFSSSASPAAPDPAARAVRVVRVELETRPAPSSSGFKLAGAPEINDQTTGLAGAGGGAKRPVRRRPVEVLMAAFGVGGETAKEGEEADARRAWRVVLSSASSTEGESDGAKQGPAAVLDDETLRVLQLLGLDALPAEDRASAALGLDEPTLRRRRSLEHGRDAAGSPYGAGSRTLGAKSVGNLLFSPPSTATTAVGAGKRTVTPSWADFASTGFAAGPAADEFGLVNPVSSSRSGSGAQTLTARPSVSRPSTSATGGKPRTTLVALSVQELDEEFADVWLDSLAESGTAMSPVAGWPSVVVAPLRSDVVRQLDALDLASSPSAAGAGAKLTHLLIHERLVAPSPASEGLAPPGATGLNRALSSASTRTTKTDDALSPRKKWKRRASTLFQSAPSLSRREGSSESTTSLGLGMLSAGRRSRKSLSLFDRDGSPPPPVPALPALPDIAASPPPASPAALPEERRQRAVSAGSAGGSTKRASRVSLIPLVPGGVVVPAPADLDSAATDGAEGEGVPPVPSIPARFSQVDADGHTAIEGYSVPEPAPAPEVVDQPKPATAFGSDATDGAPPALGPTAVAEPEKEEEQQQEEVDAVLEPLHEMLGAGEISAANGKAVKKQVEAEEKAREVEQEAGLKPVPSPFDIESPVDPATPLPASAPPPSFPFGVPTNTAPPISDTTSTSPVEHHHPPQTADAPAFSTPIADEKPDIFSPPEVAAESSTAAAEEAVHIEDVRAPVEAKEASEVEGKKEEQYDLDLGAKQTGDTGEAPTFTLSPPPEEDVQDARLSDDTVREAGEEVAVAEKVAAEPAVEPSAPAPDQLLEEVSSQHVGLGLAHTPQPPVETAVETAPPSTPKKAALPLFEPSTTPQTPASPTLSADNALSRTLSQSSAPKSPTPSNSSTGSKKLLASVGGFLRRKKSNVDKDAAKRAKEDAKREKEEQKQLRKLREEELKREVRERKAPTPVSSVKKRVKEIEEEEQAATGPGGAASPAQGSVSGSTTPVRSRTTSGFGSNGPASPTPVPRGLARPASVASSLRAASPVTAVGGEVIKPAEVEAQPKNDITAEPDLAAQGPVMVDEPRETSDAVPASQVGDEEDSATPQPSASEDQPAPAAGQLVDEVPTALPAEEADVAQPAETTSATAPLARYEETNYNSSQIEDAVADSNEHTSPAPPVLELLAEPEQDVTGPVEVGSSPAPAQEAEHLQVKLPSSLDDLPSPTPSPTPQPDAAEPAQLVEDSEPTQPIPEIQPPVFVVEPAESAFEESSPVVLSQSIEDDHTGPIPSIEIASPPAPAQESEHLHVKVPSSFDDLPSPMPSPTPAGHDEGEVEPLAEDLTETIPEIRPPVFAPSHDAANGEPARTSNGHDEFAPGSRAVDEQAVDTAKVVPAHQHEASESTIVAEPQHAAAANADDDLVTPVLRESSSDDVGALSSPRPSAPVDLPVTPTKSPLTTDTQQTPLGNGLHNTPHAPSTDDVFSAPSPATGAIATPTRPVPAHVEHVIRASPSQYSIATTTMSFQTADSSAQSSADERWEAPEESF